ncbi:MAG: hypothetical protein WCO92_06730, partial [Verrucomicrobiota bacterium]
FLHNVKMLVGTEEKILDPNDPFYLGKKEQFKIASEKPHVDKNKYLREQEWPVITTTMVLDRQNSIEKTTTITPAGKTKALQKAYANAEIGGIPSSDTTSEHAVGLRINKSDQFSIVSSGLDVPLKVEDKDVEGIIQNRFEERLLVNLETQGKFPGPILAEETPGFSAENPITISMTDFGLLTADVSKEGKAQDKQFLFLKDYDGRKTIAVKYKNTNGIDITIHVRPTVRAFNFGAQWIDRSIIGRAVTSLKSCFGYKGHERATSWIKQNEKAFDSLIGPATSTAVDAMTTPLIKSDDTSKALAAIDKFTESTENITDKDKDKDLIKTIYKNYTDGELNLDNITEEQKTTLQQVKANIERLLPEVQQARERLKYPAHYDYHDEALVLCLSSMIGAAPNIHCKSGKDRTSLLLSYSQWIMHEIKNHGDIPNPGAYTPAQRARLDKFLVGTGNSYWQFLNTMNVGNKQAAGWWSFRSNFYATLTPMLQRIVAGKEADSSN